MRDYKKILIVRTDRIGDVLLSTPVIKVLRDRYPESHIAFMVRPYAKDIVDGNPHLNEVIIYDKYAKHKSFLSTLRFAYLLKKKRFDLVLILHPTNRTHLITFLARIPERVGYDKRLSFLLTKKIKDLKHLGKKHELNYNFDILKVIGIRETSVELLMPLSKEDEENVDSFLLERGINPDDKIIAIHPAASCPSKIWPAERFARVCDWLIKEYDVKIAIICSNKDKEICRLVTNFMNENDYVVLAGFKLKELASLLKKTRLLISNDSGPVHIAVAVGIPVIAIFGRNQAGLSPCRWAPLGKDDIILHKEVGCRECLAHNCDKGFKCLKAITVEDVLNATRNFQKNFSR